MLTANSVPLLAGRNARTNEIDQPWEQDNQSWWDWYVSLADNEGAVTTVDTSVAFDLDRVMSPPPADSKAVFAELEQPYALDDDAITFFRRNGYIKLPNVLSGEAIALLRVRLKQVLGAAFSAKLDGDVRNRFLSMEMVWQTDPLLRAYVLSPRIARIGAELLGVPAVRLYHDNILSKEPDCGRTPWHFDDHHFPLATNDVVTAWIPAQPIPRAMGPLAFAQPIDAHALVSGVDFSKFDCSFDRAVARIFADNDVVIDDGPFALGEVSFHHNLSFHTAGPNRTDVSRLVMANTFFADGARVVNHPTMVSGDWQKFIPDTLPGAVAATHLNPICWPAA